MRERIATVPDNAEATAIHRHTQADTQTCGRHMLHYSTGTCMPEQTLQ